MNDEWKNNNNSHLSVLVGDRREQGRDGDIVALRASIRAVEERQPGDQQEGGSGDEHVGDVPIELSPGEHGHKQSRVRLARGRRRGIREEHFHTVAYNNMPILM